MKVALLILLALTMAIGCDQAGSKPQPYAGKPPTGIVDWADAKEETAGETPTPGIDEAKVVTLGDVVAVWTDYPTKTSAASVAYTRDEDVVAAGSQITSNQYGLLEVGCVFDTETTGTVTIDDRKYDIAQGGLFLVSVRGQKRRVKQIDGDVQAIAKNEQGLRSLLKTEPEIETFFASPQSE